MCLEIYHKCLTFDFVAILLNETIEEPQIQLSNIKNQFRLYDHPLMRCQALKTSSPSLKRTKSRFFTLSKLQLDNIQPSNNELSPIRAKEDDVASSVSNYFDQAFLTY